MSLYNWLGHNADKYLGMIDKGEFVFPCFEQTCYDTELCHDVEKKAMDIVQKDEIDATAMVSIIVQYLWETYHIEPRDVEEIAMLLNYRVLAECERSITGTINRLLG